MWYPRKVAVIRVSGKYVVCDRGNERSRMQIFTKNGHFIKKIAIRYIDIVAGLAISQAGLNLRSPASDILVSRTYSFRKPWTSELMLVVLCCRAHRSSGQRVTDSVCYR